MPKKRKGARPPHNHDQIQKICISGLSGTHALQTGLAYYFRGHYIYSVPGRIPIQPINMNTTNGLIFAGIVAPEIPAYNNLDIGNVPEWTIGALSRSCDHVEVEQRKLREKSEETTGQQICTPQEMRYQRFTNDRLAPFLLAHIPAKSRFSTNESLGSSLASHLTKTFPVEISQPSSKPFQDQYAEVDAVLALNSDMVTITSTSPRQMIESADTPAQNEVLQSARKNSDIDLNLLAPPSLQLYTAYHGPPSTAFSAPGSRFVSAGNTPYDSRSATPFQGLQVPSTLRQVASSSRLQQLRFEESVNSALNTFQMNAQVRTSRLVELPVRHEIAGTELASEIEDAKVLKAAQNPDYWKDMDSNPMKFFSRPAEEIRKCRVASDSGREEQEESKLGKLYGDAGDIKLFTGGVVSPQAPFFTRPPYEHYSIGESSRSASRQEVQDTEISARLWGLGHIRTQSQPGDSSTFPILTEQNYLTPAGRSKGAMVSRGDAISGPSYMTTASQGHVNVSTSPTPPVLSSTKLDDDFLGRPSPTTPIPTITKTPSLQDSPVRRSPKCTIHGEDCDGKTITQKRRSEMAVETRGFLEQYPAITAGENNCTCMLDWHKMYLEEKAKLVGH